MSFTDQPVIAPDLPIIDAHHHFWDDTFALAQPFSRFLPMDFVNEVKASGHRLAGSVYADCGYAFRDDGPQEMRCIGETAYVEGVAESFAAEPDRCGMIAAAIIARADLMLGEAVGPVLDAHQEASPLRFRGIRELLAYDPEVFRTLAVPEGKAYKAAFRTGVAQLERRNLILEVLGVHPMLDDIVDLARACPNVSIVVNHLGYPIGIGRFRDKQAEVFADWNRKIVALAGCANVRMKLSGVGAEVPGFGWFGTGQRPRSEEVAAAVEPYVLAAVDAFSPARCMFASNFPVGRASFSYRVLWNAFKRVAGRYAPHEQLDLFHDSAVRTYRLAI